MNRIHRRWPIATTNMKEKKWIDEQMDDLRRFFLTSTPCSNKWRAVSEPIPPAPPTTTATFPTKLMFVYSMRSNRKHNFKWNRFTIQGFINNKKSMWRHGQTSTNWMGRAQNNIFSVMCLTRFPLIYLFVVIFFFHSVLCIWNKLNYSHTKIIFRFQKEKEKTSHSHNLCLLVLLLSFC